MSILALLRPYVQQDYLQNLMVMNPSQKDSKAITLNIKSNQDKIPTQLYDIFANNQTRLQQAANKPILSFIERFITKPQTANSLNSVTKNKYEALIKARSNNQNKGIQIRSNQKPSYTFPQTNTIKQFFTGIASKLHALCQLSSGKGFSTSQDTQKLTQLDKEIREQMNKDIVPDVEQQNQFSGYLLSQQYKVILARRIVQQLVDQAVVSHLSALSQILHDSEFINQQKEKKKMFFMAIRNIDESLTQKSVLRYYNQPLLYFAHEKYQKITNLQEDIVNFGLLLSKMEKYYVAQQTYLSKQSLVYEHATQHNGMYLIPFKGSSNKYLLADSKKGGEIQIVQQIAGVIQKKSLATKLTKHQIDVISSVVIQFFLKKYPDLLPYLGSSQEQFKVKVKSELQKKNSQICMRAIQSENVSLGKEEKQSQQKEQ